jgi:hypothetical protein
LFNAAREALHLVRRRRTAWIARLDRFRDMLEDLGGGLGVTDPVSDEVVLEMCDRSWLALWRGLSVDRRS